MTKNYLINEITEKMEFNRYIKKIFYQRNYNYYKKKYIKILELHNTFKKRRRTTMVCIFIHN